jgi:hypothetical protein
MPSLTTQDATGKPTPVTAADIQNSLSALYRDLDKPSEPNEDAPAPALLQQAQQLEAEYQSAIQQFNKFLQTDAVAFNRTLSLHKLPALATGELMQP